MRKSAFIISVLVCCFWGTTVYGENSKSMDLQGHRGARGMRPENTLPAFEYCVDQRMTTIELDTNVTHDKQLIIHHDTILNSDICLDEHGVPVEPLNIRSLSVGELQKLDCGSLQNEKFPQQVTIKNTRLMTLDAFFDRFRHTRIKGQSHRSIQFNIEIKFGEDPSQSEILEAADIMVKAIEKAKMVDRTTIQSFAIKVLPEIKKRNNLIKTSALFSPTRFQGLKMILGFNANREDIVEKTIEIKADVISPYYLYINKEFVDICHKHNIKVIPWTVNEEEIMKELFDSGVDGMISDYPSMLYNVYQNWLKSR